MTQLICRQLIINSPVGLIISPTAPLNTAADISCENMHNVIQYYSSYITSYSWRYIDQFRDDILTKKLHQCLVDGLSMLRKSMSQLSHSIECTVPQGWVRGRHQWQQRRKNCIQESESLTTVLSSSVFWVQNTLVFHIWDISFC